MLSEDMCYWSRQSGRSMDITTALVVAAVIAHMQRSADNHSINESLQVRLLAMRQVHMDMQCISIDHGCGLQMLDLHSSSWSRGL